jgi:predicted enzyme related to lactoylglutathione lyase
MARAIEFYERIFGFEKTFENGDPVGMVILERDAVEVHLTLVPGHHGKTHNVFHILVGDADAIYQRCEATRARIIKRIRDAPGGLRTFVVADPDGNRIDVGAPLPDR